MASKLAAAKMAAWSGSRVVIASARRPEVLAGAMAGRARASGRSSSPHRRTLGARKLWIAFALRPAGRIVVDDGARRAVVERGKSLLPAGVIAVEGDFEADDAVELVSARRAPCSPRGSPGSARPAPAEWVGRRTGELADDLPHEVVHRDDLVVL